MNMKKSILAIAALAFMAWGCSSSDDQDDSTQQVQPAPTELQAGTDARPTWAEPNYDLYEQIMSVDILLQDTLVKYASDQDMICATIHNEVRGVANAKQVDDNQWVFPLTICSDEASVMIGLSYYCDKLHRIFTINWTAFDASVPPTGQGGIYQPKFVE